MREKNARVGRLSSRWEKWFTEVGDCKVFVRKNQSFVNLFWGSYNGVEFINKQRHGFQAAFQCPTYNVYFELTTYHHYESSVGAAARRRVLVNI